MAWVAVFVGELPPTNHPTLEDISPTAIVLGAGVLAGILSDTVHPCPSVPRAVFAGDLPPSRVQRQPADTVVFLGTGAAASGCRVEVEVTLEGII